MSTTNMVNKISAKMKKINQIHKNDDVELCRGTSVFVSELNSVHGLNNRYISQAEYDQLVALQAYLREQKEVDVEQLTKYLLNSKAKNLRFIRKVLEAMPDLISVLILKNKESDIKGIAINYITKSQELSEKKHEESADEDEIELSNEPAFVSGENSVHGLNSEYISHAEYDQLVAFQAYLREQKEVNVDQLTQQILNSKSENSVFIKKVLKLIPNLIPRLLIKNKESDIKGFAVEYVAKIIYPQYNEQNESENLKEESNENINASCDDGVDQN